MKCGIKNVKGYFVHYLEVDNFHLVNNLFKIQYIEIRHRSAVRIRGFHPRDRGSTPRVGIIFFTIKHGIKPLFSLH